MKTFYLLLRILCVKLPFIKYDSWKHSGKRALCLFFITLLAFGATPSNIGGAIVLNFEGVDDVSEDGFDLGLCLFHEMMEPAVALVDVSRVDMNYINYTIGEYCDATISFNVTMAQDLPPNALITVEIVFDTDVDMTTGQSQPVCYFNGLGADWRIRAEVQDGVVISKSLEKYRSDGWSAKEKPSVRVGAAFIEVVFLRSDLGDLVSSSFMVYVFSEDVVDMVPEVGSELPEFSFSFPPEARLEAPSTIPEDVEILFNALSSMAFDQFGEQDTVADYMFDLDGDGLFEQTGYPLVTTAYPDDGIILVTLMVEDAQGLTGKVNHTVTVTNLPPTGLIIHTGKELFKDEEESFSGGAVDVEADVLTYRWDFGDGTTAEGKEVMHTFGSEGSYDVTLTVTDDDGGVSEVTEAFMVQEKPPIKMPGILDVSRVWANPMLLPFGLLVVCFVAFLLLIKAGVIEIEIVKEGEGAQEDPTANMITEIPPC